ncbi:MAG: transketolase [Bacillota bacterium]
MEQTDLKKKAKEIRKRLLQMIYESKTGHTGGVLSSVDILVSLYYAVMNVDPKNPDWPERDRFILSKGHSVEGLYCILADKGFFPEEELKTFSQYGSRLIGHPTRKVPGIEANTGALGHGLSIGVGMALGFKLDHKPQRVYVLMGDGELAEGSIWEAAMSASNYKLDNLTGIIDRNGLQISGNTEDVMALECLREKWEAFGWAVTEVDGHNFDLLVGNLKSTYAGKPHLIIAKTIKGKGVTFMENNAKWHHGVPSAEQFDVAISDLEHE